MKHGDKAWGQDIEPGASVTTFGKHGAGQPAVMGRVISVEKGEVMIQTPWGNRRRSISHVRVVAKDEQADVNRKVRAARAVR
jgi:hypothetical protein